MSSVISRMSVEHELSSSRGGSQMDGGGDGGSDDHDSPMVSDRTDPELQRVFRKDKKLHERPKEAELGKPKQKFEADHVSVEKEHEPEEREDWKAEQEILKNAASEEADDEDAADDHEHENKESEPEEAPPAAQIKERLDSADKSKARMQRQKYDF